MGSKKEFSKVWFVDRLRIFVRRFNKGFASFYMPFWRVDEAFVKLGFSDLLLWEGCSQDYIQRIQAFAGEDAFEIFFPHDYWEQYEKYRAVRTQNMRGDRKWGLEIGVRFFPVKDHFPPIPVRGNQKLVEMMFQNRLRDRDYNILSLAHKLEIILIGRARRIFKKQKVDV